MLEPPMILDGRFSQILFEAAARLFFLPVDLPSSSASLSCGQHSLAPSKFVTQDS